MRAYITRTSDGRFVITTNSIRASFTLSREYAMTHNVPLTVEHVPSGRRVRISPDGHVLPYIRVIEPHFHRDTYSGITPCNSERCVS